MTVGTLDNAGTLTFSSQSQDPGYFNGNLTNEGTVVFNSGSFYYGGSSLEQTAGVTTVGSGAELYLYNGAGTLELEGGTLQGSATEGAAASIDGAVDNSGGSFVPSSESVPGSFNLQGPGGDYIQGPGGTFVEDIYGDPDSGAYSSVGISGVAALDGTLQVNTASSYTPTLDDDFDNIFSVGTSYTGAFEGVANQFPAPGFGYNPVYTGNVINLDVGIGLHPDHRADWRHRGRYDHQRTQWDRLRNPGGRRAVLSSCRPSR